MMTTEKPVASHCGISSGVRKSAEDRFADHGPHTRVDDAAGVAFVESLDHLGSDRRTARARPLRSSNPEANAIAHRDHELARPPARFLERHLTHAAQTARHHAGLSGVDSTVWSEARRSIRPTAR
jgi:hypothetical protein